MTKIYFAGPLFGIADQHHNLLLEQALSLLGEYETELPQRRAKLFPNADTGMPDLQKVSRDCQKQSALNDVVLVNLDGPDADSGTAFELGIAVTTKSLSPRGAKKPITIGVRTDFRTDAEMEVGINAMLHLADKIIYKPSSVTTHEEVEEFYAELAQEIHETIQQLLHQ